jgi:hypothetical protein
MYPEIRNFAFSFEELHITPDLIEEVMGYSAGQSPDPFPEMIASVLVKGPELCEICGSVAISDRFIVNDREGYFSFENIAFNVETKMLRQLNHSMGGVIFICTAGPGIGERSRDLMAAGDFMEGYILDVLGSVTVESAIDKIQDILATELEGKGLKVTNRYSPGYCGWALSEQQKLFSLFPEGHCGIKLSDSCLMEPVKSVSGVIGYGTHVKRHLHECQLCELETCIYRKIRMARQKEVTGGQ